MIITKERMQSFAGEPGETLTSSLVAAAARWKIDTPARVCHWLAQLKHESAQFRRLHESLDYSAEALVSMFSRERISTADAARYGRSPGHPSNQPAIANCIYGGVWGAKNLGNTQPGDGWRFIGRGLKQLTGRANYARCSLALLNDDQLVYRPDMLEQPDAAALSAGWFWDDKNLSDLADVDDIRGITMLITGWRGTGDGANVGFAQRVANLTQAKVIFV